MAKTAVLSYPGHDGSTLEVLDAAFVGTWGIPGSTKECALCKGNLMDVCQSCAAAKKVVKCGPVIGTCSHVLHAHCVDAARSSGSLNCPTCNTSWVPTDTDTAWRIMK